MVSFGYSTGSPFKETSGSLGSIMWTGDKMDLIMNEPCRETMMVGDDLRGLPSDNLDSQKDN